MNQCAYHPSVVGPHTCEVCDLHICKKDRNYYWSSQKQGERTRIEACSPCNYDLKVKEIINSRPWTWVRPLMYVLTAFFLLIWINLLFEFINEPPQEGGTAIFIFLNFVFGFPTITFTYVSKRLRTRPGGADFFIDLKKEFLEKAEVVPTKSQDIDVSKTLEDKREKRVYCFHCTKEIEFSDEKCPRCGKAVDDKRIVV